MTSPFNFTLLCLSTPVSLHLFNLLYIQMYLWLGCANHENCFLHVCCCEEGRSRGRAAVCDYTLEERREWGKMSALLFAIWLLHTFEHEHPPPGQRVNIDCVRSTQPALTLQGGRRRLASGETLLLENRGVWKCAKAHRHAAKEALMSHALWWARHCCRFK